MTGLAVLNTDGVTVGVAGLTSRLAEQQIKPHVIHETVVAELAARRAGTHATKTRSDVSGGGAKPWRQKGTGRARQGSTRAPQWVGGGTVFGPTPRSHGGKVNRKARRQAFLSSLRAHAERGSAALMEPIGWSKPSTKKAAEYLRQAPDGLQDRPLTIVLDDVDGIVARSFRNIAGVTVLPAAGLQTVDLMQARSLLFERAVWERLAGEDAEVAEVEAKKKRKPRKKTPPAPKDAVVAESAGSDDESTESEAAETEVDPPADEAVESEPVPEADDASDGDDAAQSDDDNDDDGEAS